MTASPATFSVVISSDPQYPWYDGTLPPGLTSEDQHKQNSERQIRQQYESVNRLAEQRKGAGGPYQVEAVLINGDLTAFGHDWQFDKYKELVQILGAKFYPALGNHDYMNNVNDSYNNNNASRMVKYMHEWLQSNAGVLNYDFTECSYYKGELRTDHAGSLAYSFNIGKVHFVQLQNYPSYTTQWNSWNLGGARRDFYFITESFYWLENDLARPEPGDVIIVSVHDYNTVLPNDDKSNFTEPGLGRFNRLVKAYGVSAVFSGHFHDQCGYMCDVEGSQIPVFRSGAASYQDYLVADIDTTSKQMKVFKMTCPYDGSYAPAGEVKACPLNDTRPNPPVPVPPTQGYVTFFNEGGFECSLNSSTRRSTASRWSREPARCGSATRRRMTSRRTPRVSGWWARRTPGSPGRGGRRCSTSGSRRRPTSASNSTARR